MVASRPHSSQGYSLRIGLGSGLGQVFPADLIRQGGHLLCKLGTSSVSTPTPQKHGVLPVPSVFRGPVGRPSWPTSAPTQWRAHGSVLWAFPPAFTMVRPEPRTAVVGGLGLLWPRLGASVLQVLLWFLATLRFLLRTFLLTMSLPSLWPPAPSPPAHARSFTSLSKTFLRGSSPAPHLSWAAVRTSSWRWGSHVCGSHHRLLSSKRQVQGQSCHRGRRDHETWRAAGTQ